MQKRTLSILGSVFLLMILFVIRLFISTYDSVWNHFIQWVLFIEAAGIVLSVFALYRKEILNFIQSRTYLLSLNGTILAMELLFMLKNADTLGVTYLFGLLISHIILIVVIEIVPVSIKKWLGVFILFMFGAYTIGQDVYLNIFNDYFSFKEALTLREGLESGQNMYQFSWLHFIITAIMIFAIWFYMKSFKKSSFQAIKFTWRPLSLISLLMVVLLGLNMRVPLGGQTHFVSDYYLYQTVYSRQNISEKFGLLHLMGRDLLDAFTPPIHTKRDFITIEKHFQDNPKSLENHAYQGLFKDKNLVFILAESYDEIALDPMLTPNLYRLKTEGFDFQNHYTPVFQRTTSDTEFIFNTGLIPSIEDGPTISVFQKNSYRISLANLFSDEGYLTQAFHGNYKEFYQRHLIYANYGYDGFYGRDELNLNQEDGKYDATFFNQASELILPTDQKFLSFVISFSGHSPYTANHDVALSHFDTVKNIYPNDNDTLNFYRAAQIELDLMIGDLFESLEEKDLLEDTVILLSGDHYPYTMPQAIYETASGLDELYLKQQGNLYIWSSQTTHEVISRLTTSFDILPTLNALFDLSGNPTYYVGRDMFSTEESTVFYKDYSYYDGRKNVSLYDVYVLDDKSRKMSEIYLIYKKILRTNYFKLNT